MQCERRLRILTFIKNIGLGEDSCGPFKALTLADMCILGALLTHCAEKSTDEE
jgi:hypothetical protein